MKKKVVCAAIVIVAIVIGFMLVTMSTPAPQKALAEESIKNHMVSVGLVDREYNFKYPDYEGYNNAEEWLSALREKRAEFNGLSAEAQELYAGIITEDEIAKLDELEQACLKGHNFADIEEKENQINEIVDVIESRVPSVSYSSADSGYYGDGSGLTKAGGVNYFDGRRETYYSSRVLYHYRTSEWTLDNEGFYRDSAGRYVVAASDKSFGSTFQGSKGECIVLDTGCAAGTTDYYTAW